MKMLGDSAMRSKVVLLVAAAAFAMILVAMLQQRGASWSGRVHHDDTESKSISIGSFRSLEECRVAGTSDLKERGWSRGRTVCSNVSVATSPSDGAQRVFKVSDGVAIELPKTGS